jgi:hypothetical protein
LVSTVRDGGMTASMVVATVEAESILQFAGRTSLMTDGCW